MIALVFNIIINSVYSIRIPFTWQSAITYPVMPSSAIIGLLANAYQRYSNNKPPLKCLESIEREIIWAGSRLLRPAVTRSCTTSAIVKWEIPWGQKSTNVLIREFGYTEQMQILAITRNFAQTDFLIDALRASPLTCGDSESPVTIVDVRTFEVQESTQMTCETFFPVTFDENVNLLSGSGVSYWMHERCLKTDKNFPMKCYLVPIRMVSGLICPATLVVEVRNRRVLEIKNLGCVVV